MATIGDQKIYGYSYFKLEILLDAVRLDLPVLKPQIKEALNNDLK
jgi:uncharacterized protein with HEPN domain